MKCNPLARCLIIIVEICSSVLTDRLNLITISNLKTTMKKGKNMT